MAGSNGKHPEKQGRSRVGNPPVEHRFKPGQSGNPGGRPKGRTLLSVVREILAKEGEKGLTAAARGYAKQMKRGNFAHLKEYIEREEGKVPDRIAGVEGEPVVIKIVRGVSMDDL